MITEINWGAPIEAVNEDGVVTVAVLNKLDTEETDPERGVARVTVKGLSLWYKPDGKCNITHDWYIRNSVSTPTPDERSVAPEIVERLVALAERMSKDWSYMPDGRSFSAEARAIVAVLEPVDGDLVEARRLAGIWEIDEEAAYQILARGRQLEKEGK